MARRVDEETLLLRWDKKENDFKVWYPRRCDGALVMHHLLNDILKWKLDPMNVSNYRVDNFAKELEARGYDMTTFRFEIKLKKVSVDHINNTTNSTTA